MDTVTLPKHEYQKLVDRISQLEGYLSTKFNDFKTEPTEGSDEWWSKEIHEAEVEYKTGKGKTFKSVSELNTYLESLTDAN